MADDEHDDPADSKQEPSSGGDPLFAEAGVLNRTELIRRPELLEISTVPGSDRIAGRTEQIQYVASNIGPLVTNSEPTSVMIYGKTGTGKSLVSKHTSRRVVREAESRDTNVDMVYVDCAQHNTEAQASSKIARELNELAGEPESIPLTGLGPSHYYSYIWSLLEDHYDGGIVILDEIDQLQPSEDANTLLMQLSRAGESEKTESYIGVIGISNKIEWGDELNSRVLSSLGNEETVFPPYDANQLQNILSARKDAFHDGVLASEIIPRTAALAAREHGDARKAVRILKNAGKLAEQEGAEQVQERHVNEAQKKAEVDRLRELLATDTPHARYVLLALAELTQNTDETDFRTTRVYDAYVEVCEQEAANHLKIDRVRDLLREHAFNDTLESTLESGGRAGGTYKQHRLLKDPNVVKESVKREM
ncbi:Cdc6/Cdc18 family protein [Halorubrum ezzemoulense]|uniref:Cdc6/Cdc18 family protein n=1 Tax=Halorubrum ezzemoulense TaxID=337243 RepID=UPI00232FA9DE|nr:orc1/cdc6 family replication initiation protein [Halorubrum ezzemoulense]MDB2239444.1 orc1/cdc6 family replication initiation protein [Halorubrum ezzemoulense]MDB2250068.1 orc1/cdc6 family replication initiation protein [Halorubrum ezzemoulense]